MASGKSARRLLQFFKTTDAPAISAWSEALVAQLDNDVEGGQGTLAGRPVAALRGRVWVVQGDATEANNGIVWWDTGATWIALNAALDTKNVAAGKALLATGNAYQKKAVTKAEVEAGFEVSATRMVFIANIGAIEAGKVEGVAVGSIYVVPPGQKVKGTLAGASTEITYLLL